MEFGEKLKQLIADRGWSHYKLADKTGIPRPTITALTNDTRKPNAEHLWKLAGAFNIPIEELYEAIGYTTGLESITREETVEEILEKLRVAHPISIPVYSKFRLRGEEIHERPIEYIYLARHKGARRNVEAYVVQESCLEPTISEGDVVIVDRDLPGETGDIVLCLIDDRLVIGRLKVKDKEVWVEKGEDIVKLRDCQASAVVIEVIKRLK